MPRRTTIITAIIKEVDPGDEQMKGLTTLMIIGVCIGAAGMAVTPSHADHAKILDARDVPGFSYTTNDVSTDKT